MSFSKLSFKPSFGIAALALGVSLAAGAQTATAPAGGMMAASASGSMARADKTFVDKAGVSGMAEVMMGQMAQKMASQAEVKQFADRMVQDHGKANDELTKIASSKGMQVPTMLDKAHQKDSAKLEKMTGADFDREYMKHMVAGHKSTVSLFEKESKSGKDADLKAFATKTLPTLQDHLKQAQATYDMAKKAKS